MTPDLIAVFQDVLMQLEKASIDYMIVGSVASIIYGEPRMTKDMDIVIEIRPEDSDKIDKLYNTDAYYCPPQEVLRSEITNQGQFNIIHSQSGLKIDFMIRKNNPHSREEFKRRKKVPFWKDFSAFAATPEDVIIKKLLYYQEGESEKHLRDIRGILANTQTDKKYLDHWIHQLNLSEIWKLT